MLETDLKAVKVSESDDDTKFQRRESSSKNDDLRLPIDMRKVNTYSRLVSLPNKPQAPQCFNDIAKQN
jgi:hypothetical protein